MLHKIISQYERKYSLSDYTFQKPVTKLQLGLTDYNENAHIYVPTYIFFNVKGFYVILNTICDNMVLLVLLAMVERL